MLRRTRNRKETTIHTKRFFLFAVVGLFLCLAFAPTVFAKPTAKKVKTKFVKTLTKLAANTTTGVDYVLVDLDGDGVNECLANYSFQESLSGPTFALYEYINKKAKNTLTNSQYGLSNITIYPSTKTLVLYGSGRGGEWYAYYVKNSKGNYKMKVGCARVTIYAAAQSHGEMTYLNKSGELITEKTFNKTVKKLTKGKSTSFELYGDSIKWKKITVSAG